MSYLIIAVVWHSLA